MSTTGMVLLFLAANTAASLVVFGVALAKNRSAAPGYLLISFFVPIVGVIMCLIMVIPLKRGHYAIGAEESIRKMKLSETEYVDPERLKSTVPANDALTLSSEHDRREYLLGLLRQREMDSLRTVLHQAVYNDDSEASHYAASAIMELQRLSYNKMERASKAYLPGPEGRYLDAVDYAAAIMLYLQNSEVGQMENHAFRQRYEEVMQDLLTHHPDECAEEDYNNMLSLLMRCGHYEKAQHYVDAYIQKFPASESAYLMMMQLAYYKKDEELFLLGLEKLRNSDVLLSPGGLATVRFWMRPTAKREGDG